MDTVWTIADAYFDVCSAAGATYAGIAITPAEYGRLLAHAHRTTTRALARVDAAGIDIATRPLARLISEAARKGMRAITPSVCDTDATDATDDASAPLLAMFMAIFRATVRARADTHGCAHGEQIAPLIGDLIEAAIARKQLSFASLAQKVAA